jgi:predicted RNA-binding Zn-ribbon protein involved in translation (DUF1610 family)
MLKRLKRRKQSDMPNPEVGLKSVGSVEEKTGEDSLCPVCGTVLVKKGGCCKSKINWLACAKCGYKRQAG